MRSNPLPAVVLALATCCAACTTAEPSPPGAGSAPWISNLTPSMETAAADLPGIYRDGCHAPADEVQARGCVVAPGGANAPQVILVGDSHAAQWEPAVARLGRERGWQVTTYTKSSCPLSEAAITKGITEAPYPECSAWTAAVTARLVAEAPDLVISSSQFAYRVIEGGQLLSGPAAFPALADGMAAGWDPLLQAGIPVVALQDTPRPGIDVPDCLAQQTEPVRSQSEAVAACSVNRSKATVGAEVASLAASSAAGRVQLVNLTDDICEPDACPPVLRSSRGAMLVYRDEHHLTATFAASLAPALGEALPAVSTSR